MGNLTAKQEAFSIKYIECGDASASYRHAYAASGMTAKSINENASRLLKNVKVSARVEELREKTKKIAEKRFTISVEKRLKWLEEIVLAGIGTYSDANGTSRRENLAAAKGAIETLNTMLGIGEDDEEKGSELTITFNVAQPIRDVKVTKGE